MGMMLGMTAVMTVGMPGMTAGMPGMSVRMGGMMAGMAGMVPGMAGMDGMGLQGLPAAPGGSRLGVPQSPGDNVYRPTLEFLTCGSQVSTPPET